MLPPPWDTVLCSRIWGTVWQADGRLGQNIYKDTSSCRTRGQTWKRTSVPLISRSYLAFPLPDNAQPLLGACLCDTGWRGVGRERKYMVSNSKELAVWPEKP